MTRQPVFEALGRRIGEEQDGWLAQTDLNRVRERVLATQPRLRRVGSRWSVAWAGGLAAAAALVVVVGFRVTRPAPLGFAVGNPATVGEIGQWISAPTQGSIPIRFSDGSELRLDGGTRARVVQVEHAGAHLVIENGRAMVNVVPQPGAAWRLSTGPFSIQVVGTSFSVRWDPEQDLMELRLYEGKVLVSGCLFGTGRPVLAGETLRASCQSGRFEVGTGDPEPAPGVARQSDGDSPQDAVGGTAQDQALGPAAIASPGAGVGAVASSWKQLAGEGKYREALAAVEASGFEAECQSASAADLAALGDVARYAGQLGKATQAYQLLRSRFPGTGRAAVAAYTLGRMAFDQQGNYGQAAQWFQTYLGEQPGGGLAREALGRLMEAMQRSGAMAGAADVAARYLKRYPDGPHARLARQLSTSGVQPGTKTGPKAKR